eukprot:11627153-Alexandrium_andersonii.AAC.1
MSASLVGSEMCIRDRLSAVGRHGAPAFQARACPRCCVVVWAFSAVGRHTCLLYTSDAADDM